MKENGKKRPGRRDYLNDYVKNAAGEYVYTGGYYGFVPGQKTRTAALTELSVLWCAGFCAQIAAGFFRAAGMADGFFVLIPYVAGLYCSSRLGWALGRLCFLKEPLKAYVYGETAQKLPLWALLSAVTCALTLAGTLLYDLLRGFGGRPGPALLVSALHLASSALYLAARRRAAALRWETREGPQA